MVDFVRPNFLGTRTELGNMFERPIQNGQCVDSNPADVKLMKERVYVGETGPILDSRGFSRISPDPLRQKIFFLAKDIL